MNLQQIIQSLGDRFQGSAGVNTIYGAPITAQGKTIIPVGRVAFGFGAGRGPNLYSTAEPGPTDLGGGLGGGIVAHPVGVVEVSPNHTRFIPCHENRKWLVALLVGAVIGFWMRSRG